MYSVSVVIPNYNGRSLLERNIAPLLEALQYAGVPWEVIVVDDASSDDSAAFVAESFPEVKLLRNETNCGFAATVNSGIFAALHYVVMTLNSDVLVEKDTFATLLPRFADPDLFALSPSIIDPKDGRNQASYRLMPGVCWFIDRCVQSFTPQEMNGEFPVFFASGGATCYHRARLMQLGGFPTIYHPFYIEDVDLSYQGWKAGWKCLLEPRATVWHESSSTIKKYHNYRRIRFTTARNKHIFMWVNITDPILIFRYFLLLLPSMIWDILSFRKYKFVGFFMALPKIAEVVRERSRRRLVCTRSDRSIIEKVRLDKMGVVVKTERYHDHHR